MKVLQIFGWVVAVHLIAFIFIFASPGCSSSPRNVPTPDATMPNATPATPVSYTSGPDMTPVDLGTSGATTYAPAATAGRASPTRPGSPNAVAVTPAKAAAEVASVSTYTVQKGDSLWSIAKKNHLTVGELAKANSLSTNSALQPGKKLLVPVKTPAPSPVATASTPSSGGPVSTAPADVKSSGPAPAREVTRHTVQAGESLGTIARKYGMTVGELAAANNITDPAKIFVGQSLIVAGGKSGGPRPVASSSAGKPAAKPAANATGPVASPAASTNTPTAAETAAATPHFEIKAPPPGQDLDAGLKESTTTAVPTVKVEEPATTEEPPKK